MAYVTSLSRHCAPSLANCSMRMSQHTVWHDAKWRVILGLVPDSWCAHVLSSAPKLEMARTLAAVLGSQSTRSSRSAVCCAFQLKMPEDVMCDLSKEGQAEVIIACCFIGASLGLGEQDAS